MTFLDERAEAVRVYTDSGTMDLATADLGKQDVVLAKLNRNASVATACSN